MIQKTPKAILFDLDGTLCDSLPGLLFTLNALLSEHCKPLVTANALRGHADKGSLAMITFAFNIPASDPQTEPLRQTFLQRYLDNMAEHTHFFPQVTETLDYLKKRNIPWGIATNRPAFLMPPLIKKYQLDAQAACLVYGDTLATSKPEPEMLLHACDLINVPAHDCIYVGDTENDLVAAQRANMSAIFAEYGYLRAESKRDSLMCDARLDQPRDLIRLLQDTHP